MAGILDLCTISAYEDVAPVSLLPVSSGTGKQVPGLSKRKLSMNRTRIAFETSASQSRTNSPFRSAALRTNRLSVAIIAVLLVALGGVWKLRAITIDLGASGLTVGTDRIGFSEMNGTPVTGTVSEDFVFAHHAFVRLFTVTDTSFCAIMSLQTSGSGLVGFLNGTGYLTDAHGNAIPGYGITGRASSSTGAMSLGFFPLLKDESGNPNEALNRPLDFYGVHFDITFPDVDPSIETMSGQFFLTASGTTFGIGPHIPADVVPDAGSTALLLGLAMFVLCALPKSFKGTDAMAVGRFFRL